MTSETDDWWHEQTLSMVARLTGDQDVLSVAVGLHPEMPDHVDGDSPNASGAVILVEYDNFISMLALTRDGDAVAAMADHFPRAWRSLTEHRPVHAFSIMQNHQYLVPLSTLLTRWGADFRGDGGSTYGPTRSTLADELTTAFSMMRGDVLHFLSNNFVGFGADEYEAIGTLVPRGSRIDHLEGDNLRMMIEETRRAEGIIYDDGELSGPRI